MQNRIPSQSSFLEQAFARALARIDAERPPRESEPSPGEDESDADEPFLEPVLDGAELLGVIREPTEWLLALAYRLAGGDPVDSAAVLRLRDAFHARLAGRLPRIRKTDLLIGFGLLVGALDPIVVGRAVSATISDGLTAALGADVPIAIEVSGIVEPVGERRSCRAQRPAARRWSCSVRSRLVR